MLHSFLEKCVKLLDRFKKIVEKGEKCVDKYEIEGVVSAVNAVSVLSNGEEKLLFEIQITGAENFCVKRKAETYNLFWLIDGKDGKDGNIRPKEASKFFKVPCCLRSIVSQAFVSKIKLRFVVCLADENYRITEVSSVN